MPRRQSPSKKKYTKTWLKRLFPRLEKPIAQAITIPLIGFGAAALLSARDMLVNKPVDAIMDRLGMKRDVESLPGLQRYVLQGQDTSKPPSGYIFVPYEEVPEPIYRGRTRGERASSAPLVTRNMIEAAQGVPYLTPAQLQELMQNVLSNDRSRQANGLDANADAEGSEDESGGEEDGLP